MRDLLPIMENLCDELLKWMPIKPHVCLECRTYPEEWISDDLRQRLRVLVEAELRKLVGRHRRVSKRPIPRWIESVLAGEN